MPRGTCWKGYVQKGFKKKGNRSVPNCVAVQNAQTGKSIKRAGKQLANTAPFVGLDITDLAGLDRGKKENASIGAKLNFTEDQVKPVLNLSSDKYLVPRP